MFVFESWFLMIFELLNELYEYIKTVIIIFLTMYSSKIETSLKIQLTYLQTQILFLYL